ncbi:beta-lactamase regulator AmpE [Cognaticolwellia beringensis]|uniref:Regulatory signaling modulator protein AmpE n=1 Tax=Cognaticolwellia beringensis TaxID=1967665 RepID=A0A222G4T8_9GAMM|nr:beta-lactamase regulator AmpE [Cognaticolwellia beringensis]ASP46384.1 regulatory signaling modulator protein AmpE [Cognaticolwellia beringensis]
MSLISLLIALVAERYLSSSAWQFDTLYQRYLAVIKKTKVLADYKNSAILSYAVIFVPVVGCYFLLAQIDNALLYLIASTLILIVCFGCMKTRESYKNYLVSAFKGELTTCELHHLQLQQDKNISNMGFGQTMVWLNYRYFIAVMLFFVLFGPAGALFYRLLTKVNECTNKPEAATDEQGDSSEQNSQNSDETCQASQQLLFWVDWLPVRLVAFGYMFVGHFSKALPVWIENLFEFEKAPSKVLIAVAQMSEDFMVDADDCTAEPCLLVKLAKRTLLLFLAVISVLTLTGIIT